MPRLTDENVNSKEFWNVQYAPERRADYLSSVWSLCNTHRFDKLIEFVWEDNKFLDLGCGFGVAAKQVKDTYPTCEVWGTDQSDVIINDLIKERPDITFKVVELGELILPNNYFDVVFAGDIIEHLTDPNILFREANRVLKKDGKFILTTPDGDCKPYLASPDHVWLFTHDELDTLYKENGFSTPSYPYIPGNEGVMVIFSCGEKL